MSNASQTMSAGWKINMGYGDIRPGDPGFEREYAESDAEKIARLESELASMTARLEEANAIIKRYFGSAFLIQFAAIDNDAKEYLRKIEAGK